MPGNTPNPEPGPPTPPSPTPGSPRPAPGRRPSPDAGPPKPPSPGPGRIPGPGAPSKSRIGIGHPGHSGQRQYHDRRCADQSCCRPADYGALHCHTVLQSLVCLLICVLALSTAERISACSCQSAIKARTRTFTIVPPALFGHREVCARSLGRPVCRRSTALGCGHAMAEILATRSTVPTRNPQHRLQIRGVEVLGIR